MTSRKNATDLIVVLALLAFSAFLVHSLHTLFDIVDGNKDFDAHYAWSLQFSEAFRAGDYYPRWMPLGNHGLGEPVLLFYSPLFYVLVSLAEIVTGNTWIAMQAVEVGSTAVAGVFTWLILRRHVSPGTALVGAVLVETTPMVFMVFHYFNGFPWGAAFAAYAALVYFASDTLVRGSRGVNVGLCLAVAALVATHIVSGVMALLCLGLTTAVFAWRWRGEADRLKATIWPVSLSVAGGIGLTLVYLYPALASLDLVASSNWVDRYPPHASFAFPTVTALVFGIRWLSFQWIAPGLVLPSVVLALIYYRRHSARLGDSALGNTLLVSIVVSSVALFLASELSYPLWQIDTPLRKVQAPYRFIFIACLPAVIATVLCLRDLRERRGSRLFAMALAAPLAAAGVLFVALNLKVGLGSGAEVSLASNTITPYASYSEYATRYRKPAWRDYRARGGLAGECLAHGLECRTARDARHAWTITGAAPARIVLPIFYFPSWRLMVDGSPAALELDEPTGLAAARLGAGRHDLRITWQRLPQERLGLWLSLASAAWIAALALWRTRRRRVAEFSFQS